MKLHMSKDSPVLTLLQDNMKQVLVTAARAQYVLNGTIPLFTLPRFWAHRNPSNGSKNPRRTQDTWVCQRSPPQDDKRCGRRPRPSRVPLSSQAAPPI